MAQVKHQRSKSIRTGGPGSDSLHSASQGGMVSERERESVRLIVLCATVLLIVSRTDVMARVYNNARFGFQVKLPPGKVICGPENSTSDHGFAVLFNTRDCLSDDDTTRIYIEASYNASDLRSTFEDGELICGGAMITPSPFWVSGYRFHQCASDPRKQPKSIKFFFIRPSKSNDVGEEVAYNAGLVCRHDECRKVMMTMRWIFAHMKFTKRE